MKIKLLLSLLIIAAHGLYGQKCACDKELLFAKAKIEKNYSGFGDKINATNRDNYQARAKSYALTAKKIKDPFTCAQHIRDWMSYFEEGNLQLNFTRPAFESFSKKEIEDYFANTRMLADWDEEKVMKYLNSNTLDPIEGIWENNRKTYRTAIIKEPRKNKAHTYVGIILAAESKYWQTGMVKLYANKKEEDYSIDFYYLEHDPKTHAGILINPGVLLIEGLTQWKKVFPKVEAQYFEAFNPNYYREHFKDGKPKIQVQDSQTVVLKLPSFRGEFAPTIDSMIRNNFGLITSKERLIIDLRGNEGGSDFCFAPLIPLVYTNPIYTEGVSVLASEDNINSWEILLDNPKFSMEIKGRIRELVAEMKLKKGKFVNVPGETTKLEEVLPKPSHIGILVDKKCAGATEQFLLLAKQSTKVTIYGQPTAGILDYAYMRSTAMPNIPYRLYYATAKSQRLPHKPINPTGIMPHIIFPTENMMELAANDLKTKKE